jgi:outer membrane immunogenic protein
MNKLFTAIAVIGTFGTSATAQDWGGYYGGLSFGGHSGEKCYVGATCPSYFIDGDDISLLGGYNFTTGPWVYGAELSISVDGVAQETIDTEYLMTDFIDLKFRGGYAVGNFLYFGAIGYSTADADENGSPEHASGALISLGADYLVTDQFFIGAEYMTRFMETDNFKADFETISVRAGYKF